MSRLEAEAVVCAQCGTVTLYAIGRRGPRRCPACAGPLDDAERYAVELELGVVSAAEAEA